MWPSTKEKTQWAAHDLMNLALMEEKSNLQMDRIQRIVSIGHESGTKIDPDVNI